MLAAFRSLAHVFAAPRKHNDQLIRLLVAFANKARRNGVVSLDADLQTIQDPFLKQALMLAVDGTEPAELRKIMRVSLDSTMESEERLPMVFESAGGFSPTIGILGAVLGLIQVMQHLDNIQEVGRGIAVAFVATIYGVGIANLFFLPFAGKMRIRMREDHQRREMMLEGVISILEGMNPRMLEVKLAGFLDDADQEAEGARGMMRRAAQEPHQPAIAGWSPMPTSSPCSSLSSSFSYAFAKADQKKQVQVTASIDAAFRSLGIFPDAARRRPAPASAGPPAPTQPVMPMNIVMGEDVLSPAKVKDDLEHIRRELEQTLSNQVPRTPSPSRWAATAWSSACAKPASSTPARPSPSPKRSQRCARSPLRWAALPTTCASRATPTTSPSTPPNSTPTGSFPQPAPRTSPASSST